MEVSQDSVTWGTVCDDLWDNRDAAVVCRMLGMSGGQAVTGAGFGEGRGSIFMDDVVCSGSESSLFDCGRRGWGGNDCNHNEDAGVRCGRLQSGPCFMLSYHILPAQSNS